MDVWVDDDPSRLAASWIARRLRSAVRLRGTATVAVSGGSTAPPLFSSLLDERVPWELVECWQVDERVVGDGDVERNAGQLGELPCTVHPMPVTASDLRRAAARYASALPERFDVVHLGLGDDGHTASWPPGEPVVDSARDVEVVGVFNGFDRMTLTPRVVNRARARAMLTTGAAKADVVERWFLRDPSLPVDRVRRTGTAVFLDPLAAARLPTDVG